MKENLNKCIVRTSKGLVIECWLTNETIKELKSKNLVSVRKIN